MNPESSPDFAKRRTFSSFAIKNLEAMRLLRKFGLLGQSHEERGKKAWGKVGDREQSFRNIAEHSLVVGMTADILFEKLQEKGYLTDEQRAEGTKAALIHDLLKRGEIEAQHAPERAEKSQYPTSEELRQIRRQILEKHGLTEEDMEQHRLARRTTFDTVTTDPATIDVHASPDTLREWTIYYSDMIVAKSDIVGPQERIDETRRRGVVTEAYAAKYRELFGDEALQTIGSKERAAEAMLQRMEQIVIRIETQLKKLLGRPTEEPLKDYIRQRLVERYRAS